MSTHEHGNDDCVDYIERIVYFIDNELDQADCAVVRCTCASAGPAWSATTSRRPSSSSSHAPARRRLRRPCATAYASRCARSSIQISEGGA